MKPQLTILAALVSLSAFGCSPAADPIGKGTARYSVEHPTTPGIDSSCGLTSFGGIGDPPPGSIASGTAPVRDYGTEITDGESVGASGEYVVECTVTKGGKIDVVMEGPNGSDPSSGETALELHGSIGDDGTGTATVTVRTTTSGSTTSRSGVPCTLEAIPHPDDPSDLQVSAGTARFTFFCSEAKTPLAEFDTCQTRGMVSVRDCLEK